MEKIDDINIEHDIHSLAYEIRQKSKLTDYFLDEPILTNKVDNTLNQHGHCEIYFFLDDGDFQLEFSMAHLLAGLKYFSPEFSKTAVFSAHQNVPDLLEKFSEFNQKNSHLNQDNHVNKFIITDGSLGDQFEEEYKCSGDKFTQYLVSECKKNNWEIPYFIGNSSDESMNRSVKIHLNCGLYDLPDYRQWENGFRKTNGFITLTPQYEQSREERKNIENQDCPYFIGGAERKEVGLLVPEIQSRLKR